jgi:hypothetical protein
MMSDDREKLFIKIGQHFEANATGRLAIIIVLIVFCATVYGVIANGS